MLAIAMVKMWTCVCAVFVIALIRLKDDDDDD
jgi:hypothetical protein